MNDALIGFAATAGVSSLSIGAGLWMGWECGLMVFGGLLLAGVVYARSKGN